MSSLQIVDKIMVKGLNHRQFYEYFGEGGEEDYMTFLRKTEYDDFPGMSF
jgi:hypothetical protein